VPLLLDAFVIAIITIRLTAVHMHCKLLLTM